MDTADMEVFLEQMLQIRGVHYAATGLVLRASVSR